MNNKEKEAQCHVLGKMRPVEEYYFNVNLMEKFKRQKEEEEKKKIKSFDLGELKKSKKVRRLERESLEFQVEVRVAINKHYKVELWAARGIPDVAIEANTRALQFGDAIENTFETKCGNKLIVRTSPTVDMFNPKSKRHFTYVMFSGETEDDCFSW